MIHHLVFEALGLPGDYRLFALPPTPEGMLELEGLLRSLSQGRIHGLNVTTPHKETVIDYLDDLTLIARSVGAVNTILWDHDQLIGDNTDVEGFWMDLVSFMKAAPEISGSQALILGAGGAARAVAYALWIHGWWVRVAARRLEQAQALVMDLQRNADNINQPGQETRSNMPGNWIERFIANSITQLTDLKSDIQNIRLIVNATPIGKYPHNEDTIWPAGLSFPAQAHAYDLVYNPAETRFLLQAKQAGCSIRGGIGMLVEQAMLSFERWTGKIPPRDIILRSMNVDSI
jgi:shikimate dehydrogenase